MEVLIMKKVLWEEMRRTEIEQAAKDDAIVIIPTGSIEQHGAHLPLNTDNITGFTIAKRAAEAINDFPVLVLPSIWTGYSPEHMSYAGTITLKFQTYVDVLSQVAACVYAHGFKKILFINSHGGNRFAVGSMRIKLAYEDNFPPSVSIEWWRLPSVETKINLVDDSHAGNGPTSIQLYLQPELVDKDSLFWSKGVFGDPSKATREYGERIIKDYVNGLMKMLRDYHDGKLDDGWGWSEEPVVGRKSANKDLDHTFTNS
jgi:creatinine amidohydrolase